MRRELLEVCREGFPERRDVAVQALAAIRGGWESDLWAFDLEHGPPGARERDGLVLRVFPGDAVEVKAETEFDAMRKLHRAGYPVPRVFVLGREGSRLGRPFIVMERIEGRAMWPVWTEAPAAARPSLLDLFCGLFVCLHRLDWRDVAGDPGAGGGGDPHAFVDGWIREARNRLAGSPYEGFLPLVEWVAQRRDGLACPRPAPVHNDFHPNNLLIRPDGSGVVIDWTGFHVSDPRFDLGWTMSLVSSYEGPAVRDAFLRGYERHAGAPVDSIECFEAIGCGRRLFDIVVSLSEGAERMGMRPEAVAAMRQQAGPTGLVYDRLRAITGLRLTPVERALEDIAGG